VLGGRFRGVFGHDVWDGQEVQTHGKDCTRGGISIGIEGKLTVFPRPNLPSLDACAPACRTTMRAPWDRLNVDVCHVAALYGLS